MTNPLKLSIVFLNYNRLTETRYTLSHLQALIQHRTDIEVIAIDNASQDGTRDFLDTQRDWVNVIHMPENVGIAGYNLGFQHAQGAYILVLDDDSHPVDEQTLDRLIRCMDSRPDIGVIACQIENIHGDIEQTWHLPADGLPGPSMAFVGCGFAIRRDLFAQIGWYPSEFFLYQNEMEVAIRVLNAGYKIHYDPACRVVHRYSKLGRPNWRRVYYPTRNTIWLIRRYFPFPSAAYLISSRLVMGLIRALQAWELGWYYQAVKEALGQPIEPQDLSPELLRKLDTFWRQNSLWHHLTGQL